MWADRSETADSVQAHAGTHAKGALTGAAQQQDCLPVCPPVPHHINDDLVGVVEQQPAYLKTEGIHHIPDGAALDEHLLRARAENYTNTHTAPHIVQIVVKLLTNRKRRHRLLC